MVAFPDPQRLAYFCNPTEIPSPADRHISVVLVDVIRRRASHVSEARHRMGVREIRFSIGICQVAPEVVLKAVMFLSMLYERLAVRGGGGQCRRRPGDAVEAIVRVRHRLPCPCDGVVRYVRDVAVCIVGECDVLEILLTGRYLVRSARR